MSTQNFDFISKLPTDKINPSPEEFNIVNTLFEENVKPKSNFVYNLKTSIVVGVLFVIFSLNYLDEFIFKIVPNLRDITPYILLIIKVILIIIIFFLIKTFLLKQ